MRGKSQLLLLTAALAIVLTGGGYVLGRLTGPVPRQHVEAQAPLGQSPMPMGGTRGHTAAPGVATGYRNDALAAWIAQQAGKRLAGGSPSYVPARQAAAQAAAAPAGATVDKAANTITFAAGTASFTVAAVPPGGPDMSFRIGGLADPVLIVPKGDTVKVRFINADTDEAHGWEVTRQQPPFEFHMGGPAFGGALARVLGDPTEAGDGAETITFTASTAGRYQYVCPMPGHAQMGMHGTLIVR